MTKTPLDTICFFFFLLVEYYDYLVGHTFLINFYVFKSKAAYMAINVDMFKAYDMVE